MTGVAPKDNSTKSTGWRFVSDLDSGLGLAEDGLLKNIFNVEEKELMRTRNRLVSEDRSDGFRYALDQVDLQVSTEPIILLFFPVAVKFNDLKLLCTKLSL